MAQRTAQVVVYGNTWSAVTAACAASLQGVSVILVSNYNHIGGVIANGLSKLDYGKRGTSGIGWLTEEFLRRVTLRSGNRNRQKYTVPSSSELVLTHMVSDFNVYMLLGKTLTSVQKTGTVINSFTFDDGTVLFADIFIDGDENGDALEMSGVTMEVGRESIAEYGESLAGFSGKVSSFVPMDCYTSPGSGVLIPGILAHPGTALGAADGGVQSYGFRLPLTYDKVNKRTWAAPEDHDPMLYEYRRRLMQHTNSNYRPFRVDLTGHGKGDMNADFGFPIQWEWPNATPAERVVLLKRVHDEQRGWLHFLSTDPSVHENVRNYVNSWGLCKDEFTADIDLSLGWPRELYVRVSRRMKLGPYVMTQADTQTTVTKVDGIAVAYYSMDNHNVANWATTVSGVPGFIKDSFGLNIDTALRQVVPYQIPYRALLPSAAECTNIAGAKVFNMSNVAASSLRIDIHAANAAAALGVVAAYAIKNSVSLHDMIALIPTEIQPILSSLGHVWEYIPS